MAAQEPSPDPLQVLSDYLNRWSDLVQRRSDQETREIVNAITAEEKASLQQALSSIDHKLRRQASDGDATSITSDVRPVSEQDDAASDDSPTEPLAGLEATFVGSVDDEPEATFVATEHQIEPTLTGEADPDDSAVHTTLPTFRADDGKEIPASIGNYDIRSILGRGGMGVVYKARQRGLKRDVALKMILAGGHANDEMMGRFRAEAEAVAKLQHPNIVQIYEIGDENGLPYFSLEYVDGETLDEVRKAEPLEQQRAADLIRIISQAMHFAHQSGIVHRDLKPANILMTKDGVPKVTDFGLVKRLEDEDVASQTQTGAIMGTPHYMAPEQAWGAPNIGPAADVWALGAMLYALLTGRPAFAGANTMDTIMQLRNKEPVAPRDLVPSVSIDLETICLKCLQKEPEKRYGSAEELAEDLDRYLSGVPILARPIGRTERAWRWCQRNPVIAGLGTAFAVALLIGTVTSTLFGIKANSAALAEKDAREDAEEKRLLAEANAEEAKQNALLAAANAERALKQRTVALGAFNTAVEWAGTDLKNVPGTDAFKKRLFSAAVQGLNRLSEITGDDRRDLAIARGYAKAGEGFLEVGQAKEALEQFEQSHEILQRLQQTENDTAESIHHLRMGRSFKNIGRAEMALKGPEAAIDWHQKALETRKKALPLHDDPLFVKQEIADSCGDLGRALLEAGQAAAAAEVLAKGAEYRDEWLAAAPNNDSAIQQQAGLRRQIGQVHYGLAQVSEAIHHLRQAVALMLPFAERDTASSRDHLNLGLFRSDLADALLAAGQNDEAAETYDTALESIAGVREKNPDFVPAIRFHAGALYGLAVAQARLELPSASESLEECIRLRRQLLEKAGSNRQYERSLMLALARQGNTEEALKIAESNRAELTEDGGVLYQVACAYALASLHKDQPKLAEKAMETLRSAFENGHEGRKMMAIDPDLDPLHGLADFQEFLATEPGDPKEVANRD
ncbi:MAG: hypothetical protein Fues2KO_29380 [Fuerstiella sp.]